MNARSKSEERKMGKGTRKKTRWDVEKKAFGCW